MKLSATRLELRPVCSIHTVARIVGDERAEAWMRVRGGVYVGHRGMGLAVHGP